MRQVGRETRRKKVVPRRERICVKQPCQQQCTVRVCRQRNRVQDHGSSNTTLLAQRNMWAFKTRSHATCTEATLSDLPHAIDHSIEDEIIGRSSETQTTPNDHSVIDNTDKNTSLHLLNHIVTKLIKQQGRSITSPEEKGDPRAQHISWILPSSGLKNIRIA